MNTKTKGIQFVKDEKGEKPVVFIDSKKYRKIREDFYDSLIAHSRDDEPRESFESVKQKLRQQGKLNE